MNMGQKWTDDEDTLLLEELNKNIDIETISQTHKRTIGGVRSRCQKIEITEMKIEITEMKNEITEMKNEIKDFKNTIKELVDMMKAVYEFEEA
jgi:uncharacterized coiled-coil DUF342 family protein